VLPIAERYGMGILVWGPLGQGMLTGRARKGQDSDLARAALGMQAITDERRVDAVEQLIALAEEAGLPMTHLAMAFAIAHPGVTSALLGPHTMGQLDDLLAQMGESVSSSGWGLALVEACSALSGFAEGGGWSPFGNVPAVR
jgi:aryl-alcohol dehydrogenase-like predicted oxidoreductase